MSNTRNVFRRKIQRPAFIQGLNSIFGKTQEITETYPEDIIVISCAVNRLNKQLKIKQHSLNSAAATESITPADEIHAGLIKDYYSKKIVYWQLQGKTLSSFRTALAQLLTSNFKEIDPTLVGIAYSLPDFYEYDTTLDKMKEELFAKDVKLVAEHQIVKELKPVLKMSKKRSGIRTIEYWFSTVEEKSASKIIIQHNNPLIKLWNDCFDDVSNKDQTMKILGNYSISKTGDITHYDINNWAIIKNPS